MKFHVNRDGNQFGPYEQSEAKSFYALGNIAATDLVWCEGMAEWKAAAQVFGAPAMANAVPPIVPPAAPPVAPPHMPPIQQQQQQVPLMSSGHAAPQGGYSAQPATQGLPLPPKLHWGLVLLFGFLTFGIFIMVWMFIQASWVRKIDARSNAVIYLIAYLLLALIGGSMTIFDNIGVQVFGGLLQLGSWAALYFAIYAMRRSMINYYNSVEPIELKLSGVMTFFFTIFYFQYHMTRIAQSKMTGVLRPQ